MTALRPDSDGRRFSWLVVGVSSLIVVGFMGVLLSWLFRTPAGYLSSGLFQGDMPTYLCYARMAARSPTLISYANPYDFREAPWPLHVNLPITAMGAMLRVMGPAWVENLIRLAFGIGMYLALASVLSRMFGRGRWFWAAFLLSGVGAGVTWIAALGDCSTGRGVAACVREIEREHYWWALSLLRNLMYPLELLYHVVLFAQLAALFDGKLRRANWLFLLGVLCNAALGIQMMGAQLVVALASRGEPRARRVAAFAIAAAFLGYYALLLPLDPVAASFQRQHQGAFADSLGLQDFALGHGPAAFGLLALLQPSFRRWLLAQRYGLPLVAFILWTLLLTQNSRFLHTSALQPMHFTRGYLATGLVCLLLLWLRRAAEARPRLARWTGPILAGLVLVALPDNVIFAQHQWHVPPVIPLLTQPADARATVDFLSHESETRRVLTLDPGLSLNLCAMTGHRALFGTQYTTPEFSARVRDAMAFREASAQARDVGGIAIDTVVVPTHDRPWLAAISQNPGWRRVYANASFTVFFRRP